MKDTTNRKPLYRQDNTISMFPEPPCKVEFSPSMITISQPNGNNGEYTDNILTIPTGQWQGLRNHIEAMLDKRRWEL